jgi:biofilm PGA synthesis N-glycosyltransferase PgaC
VRILFWTFLALLLWCYLGYPIAILFQARFWSRPLRCRKLDHQPTVTVVIAVRNEYATISRRLQNLIAQSYPADRLKVVVVCNGSTDNTEAIAREFAARYSLIRVLISPADEGKAGALNRAVACCDTDIIVFADARQTFSVDAIARLVEPFSDPTVGGVTGRLVVQRASLTSVEGVRLYWGLESRLRDAESRTGSVVGATGAIYGVRRALVEEIPPNLILDDVYLPMRIAMQGHRIVMACAAIAVDEPSNNQRAEFARKRRTMVGNIQLLRAAPALLSPIHNPLFVRYFSHKLLRLLTPVCSVVLLLASGSLREPLYAAFFVAELTAFFAGVMGLRYRISVLSLPAAFVLMHAAIVAALWHWRDDASTVWVQPTPSATVPPAAR